MPDTNLPILRDDPPPTRQTLNTPLRLLDSSLLPQIAQKQSLRHASRPFMLIPTDIRFSTNYSNIPPLLDVWTSPNIFNRLLFQQKKQPHSVLLSRFLADNPSLSRLIPSLGTPRQDSKPPDWRAIWGNARSSGLDGVLCVEGAREYMGIMKAVPWPLCANK